MSELRQLLSLIYLQALDVEEGGADEREAKDDLCTAVLRDPAQTDTGWAVLITLCADLAAERSSADRSRLQQALLDAGIEIRAARSYRDDIERLQAYSRTTAAVLANLAHIRVGAAKIKIRRRSTDELRRAAEDGSVVVVGEPGAGKSGALHDLVRVLGDEGRDVACLAVDHLAARSLGELRGELGLNRELIEVLANWPGTQPAFLVIDALDAARADPAAKAIRDLIQLIIEDGGRWRVVASIRKFDLRYSAELRHLLSGEPPTEFQDPEFSGIRHLNVPRLSDEELAQIAPQSPALQALISRAPEELQELLRVPFNLRLMAELLGAGIDVAELTPIRTQLGLLDRYWLHRVIWFDSGREADAREAVLRRACELMVETRALRVDRSRIAEPGISAALNSLLSAQILTEWQPSPAAAADRYALTFSHHVLFDYAVERLLLRGTLGVLVNRLADDPELSLVIRPSLLLHFRHMWGLDRGREQFWELLRGVMGADRIPEIGKLIGPSVAAELAGEPSDLEPLLASIESADESTRKAADEALSHLVGSLLAASPAERPLVGPGAGPWCHLLERVTGKLRPPIAYAVRPLLVTLCEHPDTFTDEQRAGAGKSARRLLEFAWGSAPRDQWLVGHALQSVCRTFESDPTGSASLLRHALQPKHLAEHGFEELPSLAREVRRLILLDDGLVEEIYRAAFSHWEESQAPTPMGQSRILPMISNRRQDYGMGLYELAEVFPGFLTHAPMRGSSALVAIMEAYVTRDHPLSSGEVTEEPFDFNGREARIRTDYSAIWDAADTHRHDEPLKMLDAFEQHLARLAEREEGTGKLHELLEVLVTENRLAVLWRRLLLLGARFPCTLGKQILPLTRAMPILTGFDTTTPAGEFLRAVFPSLASAERERVERALLSIPDAFPADRRNSGEEVQNRLLGCLADTHLVTDEARRILAQLRVANAVPPNEPPVRFGGFTWGPYGEEEYLADEGVQVEAQLNRKIRELEKPVKEFEGKHLNSAPTPEEVAAVLPALQALRTALSVSHAEDIHPKQRNYAWGHLAAACGKIARTESLSCEEAAATLTRAVLLEASHHTEPTHRPESDPHFDEHPSWSSPAPRIEAAEGLILLARHASCASDEVLQGIDRLSTDPVPAVRFQVAARLNTLYQTAPELMWRIVERMCRQEQSQGVLQGLLSGPPGRLASAHPDRVAGLIKEVFDRVSEGPGAREVRGSCIDFFTSLYIWRDHAICREIVFEIAAEPGTNSDDAQHILRHLREPLTYGPVEPPDPAQDGVRQRAFDLAGRLLRSARDGLRLIEAVHTDVPFTGWPEADRKNVQSLVRLIDHLGTEIYFASGAFDEKRGSSPKSVRATGAPHSSGRCWRCRSTGSGTRTPDG